MPTQLPWRKCLLFLGIIFISSCSVSSDSLSLKSIFNDSSIKSNTPKCKEGDMICCKKNPERCARPRPII